MPVHVVAVPSSQLSLASRVRIGTRGSELALRQAKLVAAALAAHGVATEIVTFTTTGDRRLEVPLHVIGAKGLFTEELEHALRQGEVECCVHSLKDLPTGDPPGLELCAVLEREDPRDALVAGGTVKVSTLDALPPGATVGTSSLRRRAQLLAARPDLRVRELRGNVPTRLRKIADGEVDAAILAAAGLHRLERRDAIAAYLDAPAWLPAAGQGAIAVQGRSGSGELLALLRRLDHAPTAFAARAERTFLAALDGGCQVPIGALAVARDGAWTLHGFIGSTDGRQLLRGSAALDQAAPAAGALALAEQLRQAGGSTLLEQLRRDRTHPAPQPE